MTLPNCRASAPRRLNIKGATVVEYTLLLTLLTGVAVPGIYVLGGTLPAAFSSGASELADATGNRNLASDPGAEDPDPASAPMSMSFSGSTVSFTLTGADATIDWGDGTVEPAVGTGLFTHTYADGAPRDVSITGTVDGFANNSNADLIAISDFGDLGLSSLEGAFAGSSITSVPALPDTVRDLSRSFAGVSTPITGLSGWDVSAITDMDEMFNGAAGVNEDISGWNTRSVTSMTSMFDGASSFDQDISGWCVSNVITRPSNFSEPGAFPEPNWGACPEDGIEPTGMILTYTVPGGAESNLFYVTGVSAGSTVDFGDGNSRNLTINDTVRHTYANAGTYNVTIKSSGIDRFRNDGTHTLVSAVFSDTVPINSLIAAFYGTSALTSVTNVPSSVTNLGQVLQASTAAVAGLDTWDTSGATNMQMMFKDAPNIRGDVSGWDVGNATQMTEMFQNANSFSGDLSNWCVANIPGRPTNFATYERFTDEPNWSNCGAISDSPNDIVIYAEGLAGLHIVGPHVISFGDGVWDARPTATNTYYTHYYVSGGSKEVRIRGGNVTRLGSYDVGATGLRSIVSFGNNPNLAQIAFDNTNLSTVPAVLPLSVTNLQGVFANSNVPPSVGSWNTDHVTNMISAFSNANLSGVDLSGWNGTSVPSASNMINMFQSAVITDDLSGWCVPNIVSGPSNFATGISGSLIVPSWGTCP